MDFPTINVSTNDISKTAIIVVGSVFAGLFVVTFSLMTAMCCRIRKIDRNMHNAPVGAMYQTHYPRDMGRDERVATGV
jgi:hypothetical protein